MGDTTAKSKTWLQIQPPLIGHLLVLDRQIKIQNWDRNFIVLVLGSKLENP